MKLKLHKADRKKQDIIRQAICRGLPLVGLFAATTLAAGTSEAAGTAIGGDIAVSESRPSVPSTAGIPPPPPQQLPKETEVYVVKSGDTFYQIAKTYKISPEILKELNHFTSEQSVRLQVGQRIVVPRADNRINEAAGAIKMGEPPSKQK